ncbi:MAG: transglycosylase domain-containing protein [Deltaproteobacteria bacterium]|nr:transglycosylase domain-containing protein [Deltaproteobacteria bacterium]
MFDSAPRALVPSLVGLTFAGSLSLKGHVRFDGSALSKTYDADWDGTQSCRILEVPNHLRVDRFRQPFEKVIYTPDGQEQKMTFGPGSPHWVSWASITKHMETAVLLSEDGRFRRHHGFDKEAIVNSLRDNLLAGAFRRGGSTISMQLAKNLFLSREKVLSRKLQEAVLTLYLEQELTKQEILELYFNIIEYGPLVYGIGPAAKYHFGTTPNDLSLAQALYLGSILQNPKKQFYGADGEVSPARMDYLHKLMKTAAKLHLISAAELADGLQEKLYFGRPAIPPEQPAPLEATVAPTEESPSP